MGYSVEETHGGFYQADSIWDQKKGRVALRIISFCSARSRCAEFGQAVDHVHVTAWNKDSMAPTNHMALSTNRLQAYWTQRVDKPTT